MVDATRASLFISCAVLVAACADTGIDDVAGPQYAKPAPQVDPAVAITFVDAGFKIASDGRPATILGAATPSSYADAQCGVAARLNVTDVIADITGTLSKSQKSSCIDGGSAGRVVRFTLDEPESANGTPGGPVFGTVAVPAHIKLNAVELVTAQTGPALIDGGFNQISRSPFAGDCGALRHNQNFGGDQLLVTRTKTRGVDGDRNEWTVETRPGLDRAACLNAAKITVLRYYRMPVRLTVTQLKY
jgi:hypothetical protein